MFRDSHFLKSSSVKATYKQIFKFLSKKGHCSFVVIGRANKFSSNYLIWQEYTFSSSNLQKLVKMLRQEIFPKNHTVRCLESVW